MKLYIKEKSNLNCNKMDKKDMLIVLDKNGKEVGKIISIKNISLSIGGVYLEIELDENGKIK